MTKSKKVDLVLGLIIIFLSILALPKIILKNQGKNIKSLETALLNKKYLEKINSIYIGDSVDTLHFQKKGEIWLCIYGDLVFFADNNLVSQMLTNFSKTRNLLQISNRAENLSQYGLAEGEAFNISFFQEDLAGNKNEFSSIFFGIENSDRTRIYLKTNRKNTVYSMENDLYQILNACETEHIARINRGDCRPQVGILYLELLAEIRKIARHLFNINERSEMFYENFHIKNK